jgi:hypothetical protein
MRFVAFTLLSCTAFSRLAYAAPGKGELGYGWIVAGLGVFFIPMIWQLFRAQQSRTSLRMLRDTGPTSRRVAAAAAPQKNHYAFECTLLRVWHPGFAREQAEEACARYGGAVFRYDAECFTAYFREEGEGGSGLLALSAARDLRDAGDVSVAACHGFLRTNGSDFSGAVLQECERIGTPGKNQIYVTERVAKLAQPHVKIRAKGDGGLYQEHMPFLAVLERIFAGQAAAGDAFHSDAHLLAILQGLPDCTDAVFVVNIARLRKFSYTGCSGEVREAFARLFHRELGEKNSYRLSAVVTLASRFFTEATVPESLYASFVSTLTYGDRRVRANAVELFTVIFPSRAVPGVRACTKDPDHRVSANAWIKIAAEKFDEAVIRSLHKRVREGSVAHVASAFFALGEIALRYKSRDSMFLSRQPSLGRLLEELPLWSRHPNPMVSRQAILAAYKLQDEKINERLFEVFRTTEDPELLQTFASVFGWQRSETSAA